MLYGTQDERYGYRLQASKQKKVWVFAARSSRRWGDEMGAYPVPPLLY